jgi:hypothetical protein
MKMNLQNALLIGFSVGCLFLTKAVCEDLQVNYTVSYDQVVSTFWYNAITQPDAQVECKVPLLEDNHLKNGALDWHGYHYVKREAQKDVILNTSRPLYGKSADSISAPNPIKCQQKCQQTSFGKS